MSTWTAHDEIKDHGERALKRASVRFQQLRRELLEDCPNETRDALIECLDDAQHAFTSDFEAAVNKALSDAEPTATRDPHREHRTHFTSNGMRAA